MQLTLENFCVVCVEQDTPPEIIAAALKCGFRAPAQMPAKPPGQMPGQPGAVQGGVGAGGMGGVNKVTMPIGPATGHA